MIVLFLTLKYAQKNTHAKRASTYSSRWPRSPNKSVPMNYPSSRKYAPSSMHTGTLPSTYDASCNWHVSCYTYVSSTAGKKSADDSGRSLELWPVQPHAFITLPTQYGPRRAQSSSFCRNCPVSRSRKENNYDLFFSRASSSSYC